MSGRSSTLREPDELGVLYKLKPAYRDVIVEGRDDAAWVGWYFSEIGATSTRVFAVDDRVSIPRDIVLQFHPDVNARGRVVALANLACNWNLPQSSLTCVVDSDYGIFDPMPEVDGLLSTNYSSMEVYTLSERPLSKFLALSAKSEVAARDLTSLLKPAWSMLFALRYVLHNHTDGARITAKFAEKCFDSAGGIVTDVRELLGTTTPTPNRELLDLLLAHHQDYLGKIPTESLQGIRGHDIAPVIIQFLRLKNDSAKPPEIERLMRMSVERSDLDQYSLFQQLAGRVLN